MKGWLCRLGWHAWGKWETKELPGYGVHRRKVQGRTCQECGYGQEESLVVERR